MHTGELQGAEVAALHAHATHLIAAYALRRPAKPIQQDEAAFSSPSFYEARSVDNVSSSSICPECSLTRLSAL